MSGGIQNETAHSFSWARPDLSPRFEPETCVFRGWRERQQPWNGMCVGRLGEQFTGSFGFSALENFH